MVPRASGESPWWADDEISVVINGILEAEDPIDAALRDPGAAVELVGRGGLTDSERERLRARAQEALRYIEWMDHCVSIGAVRTSPRAAAEEGRAGRKADRVAWRAVLQGLGVE